MTEEVQVQQIEQVESEQQQQTQTNTDPYESQAREQGWKPKEEFEGDETKWRPAKDFVERGELFGKIDGMGRELKETKKALRLLQEHHTKVREVEYNRAVGELKALQRRHLEEGNSDGYLETTEILTDLKAEQKAREVVSATTVNAPDQRFLDWQQRNDWYAKDKELRTYADALGLGYAKANPELDPEEVLSYVTTQVKRNYKEKFENPNRNKPNSVEGGSTQASTKASFQLTEDERRAMNTFVRAGVMSKEDYIVEVKKMRGIK